MGIFYSLAEHYPKTLKYLSLELELQIQIELGSGNAGFQGGMKPAEFNPFMTLNLRFQPGPHKWEASVLITASSPGLNALSSD